MLVAFYNSNFLICWQSSLIVLIDFVCSNADVVGLFFFINASSALALANVYFNLLSYYVSENVDLPESSLILASLLN